MQAKNVTTSRRRFLAGAAAAVAAPYIVPSSALGADGAISPSERITLGLLGQGSRGNDHLSSFLGFGQAQILAVCDVFKDKREASKSRANTYYSAKNPQGQYKSCEAYGDFREVIARADVDAVVIAAPEFWHALMTVGAARAGKDIYCEKAMTLTVAEGRAVVETIRRYGRVFQLGTQQRSGRQFRFAAELALNGYIGKLHTVKVGVPGGSGLPNAAPEAPPPGLDYDLWLGPAPYTPYTRGKCSFNWYFMYDYCAGWIQSWGVHHIDSALWGAPSLGRGVIEVDGTAIFPQDGLGNTSTAWRVNVTGQDGLKLFFTDDGGPHGHGVFFEGDKGWVKVDRGGIWSEPRSLLSVALKPTDIRLYESNNHAENFLDCIKSRKDPVASVEAGHNATTMTLVADIATRMGRKLKWDWNAERFVGDDAANRMLRRTMRSPWCL